MPKNFDNALMDAAEIMQFESWLRFYFIQEEGDALMLRVPEQAVEKIKENYEHLAPLLETMNDCEMTYENSVNTVCQFVVTSLDGNRYSSGVVGNVFDSPEFQREMKLFHIWTQVHEEQLEQAPMEFETWRKLFGEWKSSDKVQSQMKRVEDDVSRMTQCSTKTVQ